MFASRNITLLLVFLLPTFLPVVAHSQALQNEALSDNRRQSTLESLERIMYEQYNVLNSDRPVESLKVDLIAKDQLILWERITEAQKYLTFYDVADLMSDLADNYYVLRERMNEMVFQPAELTQNADMLRDKLAEYVDMEPLEPEPEVAEVEIMEVETVQNDIPPVPEAPGVVFNAGYVLDAISIADGGVESGTGFAQGLDLMLSMDLEKTANMKGTSLFFHGAYNQSNGVSSLAGDWQGISNVEGPDVLRLFQAWVDQKLFSDHASLRMGLYNLNTEFYALSSAGLFVNNGFGIGGEFGRSGKNGPSITPITSLAFRFALHTYKNEYLKIAVLDGVPGNPAKPGHTHILLSQDDGALVAAEGGYMIGAYGSGANYMKVGIGYWMYTAPHEEVLNADEAGNPVMSEGNQGAYALIEGTVFKEGMDSSDGLTLFGRMGFANKTYNDVGLSWSAGFVYNGLFPGRSSDAIGLAVTSIHAGADFQDAASISGLQMDTFESVIEFTYSLALSDWLTIQPDLQYVINPGLGLATDQTMTAGARLKVGF